MPQDAFTYKYLSQELNTLLLHAKVNKIVQPDNDSVVITVYTGKKTEKLLLSVNPSCPRISIINYEVNVPLTAPNFCMLLRKHLSGAEIIGVSLIGFDRIIKIDFLFNTEFFGSDKKTLYVELMGRYSNIILTENGIVLGGNRGINFFDNGVRPLISNKPYTLPPLNNKLLPSDTKLKEIFNNHSGDLIDMISANVCGLSIETIREIVYLYNKKYDEYNGDAFYQFFIDFIENSKINPCVIYDENGIKDVCAFPYLSLKGEVKYFDTLILAEEEYFREKLYKKQFKEKQDRLLSIVNSALKKAKKKLSAILSREKDASNSEQDKLFGELILSNIYKLKGGESQIKVLNYYDNTEVVIPLDKNLTPSKNAEIYYKRFNKKKRTLEMLIPQIETAESEIQYLNSVLEEINLVEDISDFDFIKEELEHYGLIAVNNNIKRKKEQALGYRLYNINGHTFKVGRNNAENDKLTFSAKPEYIWFHAKDFHSSHAILESEKELSEKELVICSEICAYYSKGRSGGKTEIVYTKRKNVKKPPKSKLGFCTYLSYKSIVVSPNKHEELLK